MENIGKQSNTIAHLPSSSSRSYQFHESLDRTFLKYHYEEDIEQAAFVFDIFLSATSIEFDELVDKMREMQVETILQKTHKIKPNFKLVGLISLYKKLMTLESNSILVEKSITIQLLNEIHQLYKKKYYPIVLSESKKLNYYVQVNNSFLLPTRIIPKTPAIE